MIEMIDVSTTKRMFECLFVLYYKTINSLSFFIAFRYIYLWVFFILETDHIFNAAENMATKAHELFYHWSEIMEGFITTRTYIVSLFTNHVEIIVSIVLSLLVYNSKYSTTKTITHQFGRSTQRAQISRIHQNKVRRRKKKISKTINIKW